jgi:hypothetical protein
VLIDIRDLEKKMRVSNGQWNKQKRIGVSPHKSTYTAHSLLFSSVCTERRERREREREGRMKKGMNTFKLSVE